MGYLNDAYAHVDKAMTCIGAPEKQREAVRAGFFMGAKTMMDVLYRSVQMDEESGRAVLDACRADIHSYQIEAIHEALSGLMKKS
ncbi:hypothetical protein BDI4_910055 [Burkholderia diffusa]|uniref:hypothetical protein n=1 Tax=Burkholderia diffusa TaxID=488732 RepID=UPI001CB2CA7B|nr:hypothetical protein [Burkholderia diffusa]CAG9265705.1 hypothetical protein BDI4_910055 [Burkholderia diffusa]